VVSSEILWFLLMAAMWAIPLGLATVAAYALRNRLRRTSSVILASSFVAAVAGLACTFYFVPIGVGAAFRTAMRTVMAIPLASLSGLEGSVDGSMIAMFAPALLALEAFVATALIATIVVLAQSGVRRRSGAV